MDNNYENFVFEPGKIHLHLKKLIILDKINNFSLKRLKVYSHVPEAMNFLEKLDQKCKEMQSICIYALIKQKKIVCATVITSFLISLFDIPDITLSSKTISVSIICEY